METLEEIEDQLRVAIAGIPPRRPRLPPALFTADDEARADVIGNLHAAGLAQATVELLIDTEEEPALRVLLVGLLRGHPVGGWRRARRSHSFRDEARVPP